MDYRETNLHFLCEDLIKEYEREQGEALYALTCKKYADLCEQEIPFENHEMNEHIFKRFLPTLSLYRTLTENGISKEAALMNTYKEIQHHACCKAKENAKLTKMPFSYGLFRLFAKSHMKKNYPLDGFTVEWKGCDAREIHFNIVRCIYKDLCEKYHCPELCAVFCQSDQTAFAGYEPRIRFERSGTLGAGAGCCDFHFFRGCGR